MFPTYLMFLGFRRAVVVVASGEQLAATYVRLLESGQKVTVRALKAEAQVSTDAAAAWLREVEPAPVLPAAPDLSAAVGIVWAAAWQAAQREAVSATEMLLAQARDGEAAALVHAEQAENHAHEAQAELDQANNSRAAVEARLAELGAQLAQLGVDLAASQEKARSAELRAVRAEAEADSVRTVFGDLRSDLRTAIEPHPANHAPRPARSKAATPKRVESTAVAS